MRSNLSIVPCVCVVDDHSHGLVSRTRTSIDSDAVGREGKRSRSLVGGTSAHKDKLDSSAHKR